MTELQQVAEIIEALGEKGINAFYFYVIVDFLKEVVLAVAMFLMGYGVFRGIKYFYDRENPGK